MSDWIQVGSRCRQTGSGRRTGIITADIWSGYVAVQWDNGREDNYVHIADIKPGPVRAGDE